MALALRAGCAARARSPPLATTPSNAYGRVRSCHRDACPRSHCAIDQTRCCTYGRATTCASVIAADHTLRQRRRAPSANFAVLRRCVRSPSMGYRSFRGDVPAQLALASGATRLWECDGCIPVPPLPAARSSRSPASCRARGHRLLRLPCVNGAEHGHGLTSFAATWGQARREGYFPTRAFL